LSASRKKMSTTVSVLQDGSAALALQETVRANSTGRSTLTVVDIFFREPDK
jgi:hypothetical protein